MKSAKRSKVKKRISWNRVVWCYQDTTLLANKPLPPPETLIKQLESPVPDLVHASLYHLALVLKYNGSLKNEDIQYIAPVLCRYVIVLKTFRKGLDSGGVHF